MSQHLLKKSTGSRTHNPQPVIHLQPHNVLSVPTTSSATSRRPRRPHDLGDLTTSSASRRSRRRLSILVQSSCSQSPNDEQQVEEAAFLGVEQRLARRLAALADATQTRASAPEEPIKIRIAQAELANFLNVSRQVVNGYLREWQREGYVKVGRGSVTLLDLAALAGKASR